MSRIAHVLIPVLALSFLCASAPPGEAKEPSVKQRIDTFKKTMRAKDPKTRARAFDYLKGTVHPWVVDAILWGVKELKKDGGRIRQAQKEDEALFEEAVNELKEAERDFEMSAQSSRDLDRYNKRERKISKKRDGAIKRLKNLENDFTRSRAMMQQALIVMGNLLAGLPEDDLGEALALLNAKWLQSKEIDDKLRWVDAVGDVHRPIVKAGLHAVVDDAAMPLRVRTAAIEALVSLLDGPMMAKAFGMLELPTDQGGLLVAAIAALRRLHDRRCIEPLIRFLERTDIKRTREDAHRALMSLTGQEHGPYADEWKKWWAEAQAGFQMPKDPRPPGRTHRPDKGGTFYGIHTFSDRILFVIDISGSMDRAQKGEGADPAGKTKWAVCQEQLLGFVNNLNTGDVFNVIFFNHQVIPWQNSKIDATDKSKKLLARWVEEQLPVGGTNIFDALERGFMVAAFGSTGGERPPIDTIFFLTDGKPTAGKIKDPEQILEIVREWNQTAKLTIHCVGIGTDHDVQFMKELARIGDGRYVSTVPVPEITVDQTSLHFGKLKEGARLALTVKISNTGSGIGVIQKMLFPLGGESFHLAGDTKTPLKLDTDQSVEVRIEYAPKGAGRHRGRLQIFSNDGSAPRIAVELYGECAVTRPPSAGEGGK